MTTPAMTTPATTTDGPAIEARGLRKTVGEVLAVDDLSFSVPRGSVFGLVGRNGAGKTTAIRLLLGLLRPDAGSSSVLGADSLDLPRDVRRRIGYLSEEPFPYDDLAFPRLLRFVSAFFPSWDAARAEALAARFQVPQSRTLREMSLGERRRAEMVLVLAPDPEILVLDDPWLGLDAVARREFLLVALEAARDAGKTILFTSHILTDVERIVDRVAFLRGGSLRAQGELDEVKARTKRLVVGLGPGELASSVVVPGEVRRRTEGRDVVVVTEVFDEPLLAALRARHASVEVVDLNLEEIFCELLDVPAEADPARPAEAPRP